MLIVATINLVVTIKCHVVNVKKMFSASPLPTSQKKKIAITPPPPLISHAIAPPPSPKINLLIAHHPGTRIF